ncbi:MAG: hypothetical protein MJZ56_06230 [Bacteroidales bacterium]|nr:hypothetical protein [Bacteroidales bacterium]
MKKISLILASLTTFVVLNSFVTPDSRSIMLPESTTISYKATYHVDAELKDEEETHMLNLYSNGKCVLNKSNGSRLTGTYDIKGSTIYINWSNGEEQQGYVTSVEGQVKSVRIEGVTLSRRVVVSRH